VTDLEEYIASTFRGKICEENNNKYMSFQSNTTMFIIQFSGNKFRSFRPSSDQHYMKFKRLVICSAHILQVVRDPIYTIVKNLFIILPTWRIRCAPNNTSI
jgi:hypothetical protein